MSQVAWTLRGIHGEWVDTIYYSGECDEAYIRRAEGIPEGYTLSADGSHA